MREYLTSTSKLPMFRSANGLVIKLKCAARRGVDPEEILQGTGLHASDLDDPEIFITPAQELLILRKVLDRVDDPQFGLFVGRNYDAVVLGKWAIAAMYSTTVMEAFQIGMRYMDLSHTYFQIELKVHGHKAYLTLKELMDLGRCRKFLHESHIKALHQLCSGILGEPVPLHDIGFAFAKPDYARVYQEIFNCPVRFNAEQTVVIFNSDYLSLPMPQANPLTKKIYENECKRLLQSLNALETTRDMVYRNLMCDHEVFLTLEQAAHRPHMSSRTLRRRLQTEGSSFKEIAEQARRVKAIDLLQSTDHSLQRIAECLGYSDVPNFCHAFKRWTGRTPSSYRKADPICNLT